VHNIYFNSLDNEDWKNFFPNRDNTYENCKFHFNSEEIIKKNIKIDFFVCFNRLGENQLTKNLNFYNSLLIACEPPSVKKYEEKFLKQFNYIFCSDPKYFKKFRCNIPIFPWHVGINREEKKKLNNLYLDELQDLNIKKNKLISVIVTEKNLCKEHKIRKEIIEDILKNFGSEIDVFGRDQLFISDKKDALQSYHYHICIENYFGDNFFSEKILDPLLMRSNPIYLGSRNIKKFFDTEFYALSQDKLKNLNLIENILSKKENFFEFEKQRQMVIQKYNFFKNISEFVNNNISDREKFVNFKKENEFKNKVIQRIKRILI